MKFAIYTVLSSVLFLTPVNAETLDKSLLETPGTIWIMDTLTESSRPAGDERFAGTTPFFSYVKFEDGRLEDGFLGFAPVVIPESCDDFYTCEEGRSFGVFHEANYEISGDGIGVENVNRTEYLFSPAADRSLSVDLTSETFVSTANGGGFDLDGNLLNVKIEGSPTRRYFRFSETEMYEFMGLIGALEISLTENGECVMKGHRARRDADRAALLDVELALLKLSEISAPLTRDHMNGKETGPQDIPLSWGYSMFIQMALRNITSSYVNDQLSVGTRSPRTFTADDLDFDQLWANVLSQQPITVSDDELSDTRRTGEEISQVFLEIANRTLWADDQDRAMRSILCP